MLNITENINKKKQINYIINIYRLDVLLRQKIKTILDSKSYNIKDRIKIVLSSNINLDQNF